MPKNNRFFERLKFIVNYGNGRIFSFETTPTKDENYKATLDRVHGIFGKEAHVQPA